MTKFLPGKFLAACLAITCLLTPVIAQAQDAIGRVILASGIVTAVNASGAERRIARGSEIFVDETITTGPGGTSQLRLTDGAVLTLEADSFFTVDEYEFDGPGGAADSVIMTMARGTMRTLTGVIGDDPADTYEMNTPFASIGVRGTEYAIVVDNTGRVRVFVFDGSVSVAPGSGGVPTIVGLQGEADAVELADDATVDPLTGDDIPQEVLDVVANMRAEAVSEAQVSRLPAADTAVQVQRSLEQRQQQEQQNNQEAQNPGAVDAAGNLVDADGRVQIVGTETELINARAVVVISVSRTNPNAFVDTVVTASPN